jgi:hypothetical protein
MKKPELAMRLGGIPLAFETRRALKQITQNIGPIFSESYVLRAAMAQAIENAGELKAIQSMPANIDRIGALRISTEMFDSACIIGEKLNGTRMPDHACFIQAALNRFIPHYRETRLPKIDLGYREYGWHLPELEVSESTFERIDRQTGGWKNDGQGKILQKAVLYSLYAAPKLPEIKAVKSGIILAREKVQPGVIDLLRIRSGGKPRAHIAKALEHWLRILESSKQIRAKPFDLW